MNAVVEFVDDTSAFFAPVSSDLIDELIGQYRKMRQHIEQTAVGKELIPGATHEFSKVFDDQFKGTSVSVVIVKIVRVQK